MSSIYFLHSNQPWQMEYAELYRAKLSEHPPTSEFSQLDILHHLEDHGVGYTPLCDRSTSLSIWLKQQYVSHRFAVRLAHIALDIQEQ